MRMRSEQPHVVKMPGDILQKSFTLSFIGYWFGTGVGFIRAGVNLQAFLSGILLRDSAIFTLTGASLGVVYPMGAWAVSKFRRRNSYTNLDELSANRNLEHTHAFYSPSISAFNAWDAELFLASQAIALLAAVISTNVGSDEKKSIGDFSGKAIGTMCGLVFGFLGMLVQYLSKRYLDHPIDYIKKRHWFNNSRHDVSLQVRLFCGLWIGYAALSVMNDPMTDTSYNEDRMLMTFLFAGFALVSPFAFGIVRRMLKGCYPDSAAHEEAQLLSTGQGQRFSSVHWYSQSRIELPWYARLLAGVLAVASMGAVMATYRAVPFNKTLLYVYSAFTIASPMLFALINQILSCYCPTFYRKFRVSNNPPLKLSFDMPWYARIAFAALAGNMIGDAILSATADPKTYFSKKPSTLPVVVCVWITVLLAAITPMLMAGIDKLGFSHPIINPTDDKHEDVSWPWYSRLLMGAWLGALLGTAFGTLCHLGEPADVIPIYIGPDFLSLSNAVGATTGVFVGSSIALLWPLAQLAWNAIDQSSCFAPGRLFRCCTKSEDNRTPSVSLTTVQQTVYRVF